MTGTAFTDAALVAGPLYATVDRIAQRTSALHAAKISGGDATATIVDLAAQFAPIAAVVCDIGCGRGTTTLHLAARLAPTRLIALDQSQAMLATVADRARRARHAVKTVCADVHQLPLIEASVDVAIAAFCLYHSPHPEHVVAEIARCLAPGRRAVLVTKSADSYHEVDQVIAESGLDPQVAGAACTGASTATRRPRSPRPRCVLIKSCVSVMCSGSPGWTISRRTWPPHPSTGYSNTSPARLPRSPMSFGHGFPTSRSPRPPPLPTWWQCGRDRRRLYQAVSHPGSCRCGSSPPGLAGRS